MYLYLHGKVDLDAAAAELRRAGIGVMTPVPPAFQIPPMTRAADLRRALDAVGLSLAPPDGEGSLHAYASDSRPPDPDVPAVHRCAVVGCGRRGTVAHQARGQRTYYCAQHFVAFT